MGINIYFKFDLEKTIQAAAKLLCLESNKQMSRLRLLKLLYIADRETLRDHRYSITGDSVIAMKHGPVLNEFYDVIKGDGAGSLTLDRYIRRRGHQLTLIEDPGQGRLNRYEIQKFQELSRRYMNADEWDIIEETREFQEWKDNELGDSPIPLEDILSVLGFSQKNIKSIVDDAAYFQKVHELFQQ